MQPSVRFQFFRSSFSKMHILPKKSPRTAHKKKTFQQTQGCKIMWLVCWWLLVDPAKIYKNATCHRLWKRKMLFMTCCWKSLLLEKIMQNGCKQAQTKEICNSCQDNCLHKKTRRLRQTRELKRKGGGSRMVRYPPSYNSADPPWHRFYRSKTGGRNPPPQDASI